MWGLLDDANDFGNPHMVFSVSLSDQATHALALGVTDVNFGKVTNSSVRNSLKGSQTACDKSSWRLLQGRRGGRPETSVPTAPSKEHLHGTGLEI